MVVAAGPLAVAAWAATAVVASVSMVARLGGGEAVIMGAADSRPGMIAVDELAGSSIATGVKGNTLSDVLLLACPLPSMTCTFEHNVGDPVRL